MCVRVCSCVWVWGCGCVGVCVFGGWQTVTEEEVLNHFDSMFALDDEQRAGGNPSPTGATLRGGARYVPLTGTAGKSSVSVSPPGASRRIAPLSGSRRGVGAPPAACCVHARMHFPYGCPFDIRISRIACCMPPRQCSVVRRFICLTPLVGALLCCVCSVRCCLCARGCGCRHRSWCAALVWHVSPSHFPPWLARLLAES